MTRVRPVAWAFVAAGVLVGLLLLPLGNVFVDRTDWRGREIAEWCNYYRASAQTDQDLVRQHSTRMTSADRMIVERVSLHATLVRPWFARCATRKIFASGPHPEKVELLLEYLAEVAQAIPARNTDNPDDYPAPLEDPAQLGFTF